MATVYVTYTCVSYGDSSVVLDTFDLACSQGASLTTKSHAPSSIGDYTLKTCDPTSISSVSGGESITAYYYAYADIDLDLVDYDTDKSIGSDTIKDCYVDGTVTISSHAPEIDGYEFYKASPSKVTVELGTNEATCYYKSTTATLTLKHYKDGTLVSGDTDTYTVTIGNSFTPTSSNYVNTYSGYTFQYAESSDGEMFESGDSSTYKVTGDVTFKYYYIRTSGSDASLNIRHLDVDTGTSIADDTVLTGLSWNSETTKNYITISSYALSVTHYQYDSVYPTSDKIIFQSAETYSATIYYKRISGYDASAIIYHLEQGTGTAIADPTTLTGLSWNSTNEKNTVTVINQKVTVDGYTAVDAEPTTLILIAPTQYSATIYYTKTVTVTDDELVANCTARWYNYAAGNTGSWSKTTSTIVITMGDYDFSSEYFVEAGVLYGGYFTVASTSAPREDYIVATATPSSSGSSQVVMTDSTTSLSAGSTATYMAYLKTINGTYMPIPAKNPSTTNAVQFKIATKPDNVVYTSGYEPTAGEEVNLLASDICKFIHVMDRTNFWFTDNETSGIDESIVVTGALIRASTFGNDNGFYEKLNDFGNYKKFTRTFENVTAGSPIYAANLIFLKTSINNMLGVL